MRGAITLLATALVLGTAAPADAETRQSGSLKFESSSMDFGSVYRGAQLSHRFRFTNAGSGPLTVQGVHAACGCTAVEVEKGKKYQPGESGFVEVKFDTTDFAGAVVKAVTVMSNEKLLPDRTLTLKAFVKTEIEADPPLADFGDTNSRDAAVKTVRIKAIKDQGGKAVNLEVRDLAFNAAALDASVAKDGDGWILTIKLKPGLAPGFLKETVVVRNNSRYLKELPVPVRATVRGNIEFMPNYLEFGAIAPSEAAKRSITMKGIGDFDILKTRAEMIVNGRRIDAAEKWIKIDTVPHEKEKKLVAVELKNPAQVPGSVHGKLYFETNDPEQKELAVDFYAFFR